MNDSLPPEMPEAAPEDPLTAEGAYRATRPRQGSREVDSFLRGVVKMGASDMHLKSGQRPRLRIGGTLRTVEREVRPTEVFEANVLGFLTAGERQCLLSEGSVDFAYELDGGVRFRINVFQQESGISVAARVVPREIPNLSELHLPPVVSEIAESRQGLVLVSGVTGSGKSTTLAAILQQINCTRHEHIVTVEDPIEFLFDCQKSLINQREIGINVKDYSTALRDLLREDPDVVLIGEMRDAETFQAALQAADTGHLVFSTVHASNAPQTITRLLNLFPPSEQDSMRESLVFGLRAVISQKLLKSCAEGVNRVPAVEVLIATPVVRKLIAEGRELELTDLIAGGDAGMLSYTESLLSLHGTQLIDEETACHAAPNVDELKRRLAGIETSRVNILG